MCVRAPFIKQNEHMVKVSKEVGFIEKVLIEVRDH